MAGEDVPDAKDHRQRILEAAVVCFLEKGFHQTGVRDIAARAGVSLGNLYNHFRGKEALIAEIARIENAELEPFMAILAGSPSPLEGVIAFADAYLSYAAQMENAGLTAEFLAEALRNPAFAKAFEPARQSLVTALADAIARGMADGTMRLALNAAELAQLILDSIEGLALRLALAKNQTDSAAREALRDLILTALQNPN